MSNDCASILTKQDSGRTSNLRLYHLNNQLVTSYRLWPNRAAVFQMRSKRVSNRRFVPCSVTDLTNASARFSRIVERRSGDDSEEDAIGGSAQGGIPDTLHAGCDECGDGSGADPEDR